MQPDDHHTIQLIRAGTRLLQRAEDAKCRGDIRDYSVVVRESDPRIIIYIVVHQWTPTQ